MIQMWGLDSRNYILLGKMPNEAWCMAVLTHPLYSLDLSPCDYFSCLGKEAASWMFLRVLSKYNYASGHRWFIVCFNNKKSLSITVVITPVRERRILLYRLYWSPCLYHVPKLPHAFIHQSTNMYISNLCFLTTKFFLFSWASSWNFSANFGKIRAKVLES
jgi:hypothetical protein